MVISQTRYGVKIKLNAGCRQALLRVITTQREKIKNEEGDNGIGGAGVGMRGPLQEPTWTMQILITQ